jgi:hypothetical protein
MVGISMFIVSVVVLEVSDVAVLAEVPDEVVLSEVPDAVVLAETVECLCGGVDFFDWKTFIGFVTIVDTLVESGSLVKPVEDKLLVA